MPVQTTSAAASVTRAAPSSRMTAIPNPAALSIKLSFLPFPMHTVESLPRLSTTERLPVS